LLARYKYDWGNLVKKYISSSSNISNTVEVYPHEIFFTFAWLLWGPSYQLKHQEEHFKLCQYAFGDESNSINVVLNDEEKFEPLWNEITNNSNGVLCSLTCKLYRAKKYINFYRENFSPYNTYFTNKASNESESTGFLLEPVTYDIKKDFKALNYYCTAYVWIMFESYTEVDDRFFPQRTVTFFEHANLANKINYEFCIDTLIAKSFAHFDRMFSDEQSGKKYRFCLAMNKTIEDRFIERLNTKIQEETELSQKYKDCLTANSLFSEIDIFSAIDSYFSDIDDAYRFVEVSFDDRDSVALLGEYYAGIYINAFPNINERESLDNILDYLHKKKNGWYGKNNYHVFLLTKYQKVVAGLICDYFAKSNCGVIEFVAVKENRQSDGLGTKIYQKAIERLRQDSIKTRGSDIDYIFCEIEKPNEAAKGKSRNYLFYWAKLGYTRVAFDYIQPAIDGNKESVNSLNLIALPLNPKIKHKKGIAAQTLKNFLFDYAKYAMRIEEPQNNACINKMVKELQLKNSEFIELEKIVQ
jgi:ribosomal protein S18 acetylase RimI-like enzyme